MRQVVYSVAMSLDGYIAGPAGEADWIVIDPEIDFEAMSALRRHSHGAQDVRDDADPSGRIDARHRVLHLLANPDASRLPRCHGLGQSLADRFGAEGATWQGHLAFRRWGALRQLARTRARRPSFSRDHPGPSRRRRSVAARFAKPSEASACRAPALCQDWHRVAGVCGYPETSSIKAALLIKRQSQHAVSCPSGSASTISARRGDKDAVMSSPPLTPKSTTRRRHPYRHSQTSNP
jgi:hypothetical protein